MARVLHPQLSLGKNQHLHPKHTIKCLPGPASDVAKRFQGFLHHDLLDTASETCKDSI